MIKISHGKHLRDVWEPSTKLTSKFDHRCNTSLIFDQGKMLLPQTCCVEKINLCFASPGGRVPLRTAVLKDAITRPDGLRVPNGCYYLCDGGSTNGEEFLASYKGVRYR